MSLPRVWSAGVVALVLTATGCGDDDGAGGDRDAGPDVDAGVPIAAPMSPAEPMPPAPPVLTPCRPGWREVGGACEPFPEMRPSCAAHEALFPGAPACETVGAACPSGEWADGLPATGVLYVRAGGGAGGTGTQDDPFRSVASALATLSGGGTIALGKGNYDEAIVIREDVELIGACAQQTRLGTSMPALGYGVIEVTAGTAVRIANVTVGAPRRQGIRFEGAVTAEVEGVVIDSAAVIGLAVFAGANVTARDVVVRNTAAHDDGTAGRGIGIEDAGVLTLERAVIELNRSEGIAVLGPGCELHATDVRVAATRVSSDGFGDGITASAGGSIVADGIVIEDNPMLGVLVLAGDPTVSLTNAVIRRNRGPGIQIGADASGTLSRVRIEDNGETGMQVQEAVVVAEDLIARRNGGRGMSVSTGASLSVTRALVEENGGTGVLAAGPDGPSELVLVDATLRRNDGASVQVQEGSRGTLTRIDASEALGTELVIRGEGVTARASDLRLHDPRRLPDEPPELDRARGIEVRVGASATIDRVLVERAFQIGIFVEAAAPTTIRDAIVRDTTARDDFVGDFGRAIEVRDGSATLERLLFERNRGAGLVAGGAATVVASDVVVTDTMGSGTLRATGKGIVANGGSQLTLSRVRLQRNREVTLAAFEAGTRIVASDVVIADSLERDCRMDVCAGYAAGIGAGAYLGATMRLERFLVDRSALVGVQLEGPSVELQTGAIAHNPIGINVLGEGVDIEPLLNDVSMIANERNIDAMMLPLPDVTVGPMDGP